MTTPMPEYNERDALKSAIEDGNWAWVEYREALMGAILESDWLAAHDRERLAAHDREVAERQTPPMMRRLNRITVQHLTEVAAVYTEAWERGFPPTQAVCEHFRTTYSTAARWVGLARKASPPLLGPTSKGRLTV